MPTGTWSTPRPKSAISQPDQRLCLCGVQKFQITFSFAAHRSSEIRCLLLRLRLLDAGQLALIIPALRPFGYKGVLNQRVLCHGLWKARIEMA